MKKITALLFAGLLALVLFTDAHAETPQPWPTTAPELPYCQPTPQPTKTSPFVPVIVPTLGEGTPTTQTPTVPASVTPTTATTPTSTPMSALILSDFLSLIGNNYGSITSATYSCDPALGTSAYYHLCTVTISGTDTDPARGFQSAWVMRASGFGYATLVSQTVTPSGLSVVPYNFGYSASSTEAPYPHIGSQANTYNAFTGAWSYTQVVCFSSFPNCTASTPTPAPVTPTITPTPANCQDPPNDIGIAPPLYIPGDCPFSFGGGVVDFPSVPFLPTGWSLPDTFEIPGAQVCLRYLVIDAYLFGFRAADIITVICFLIAVGLVVSEFRS